MVEEESPFLLLRSFEFRLIRCTLPLPLPLPSFLESNHPLPLPAPVSSSSYKKNPQLHSFIEDVLTSIESGNYARALSSNASRSVFNFNSSSLLQDSSDSASRFYSQILVDAATSFINGDGDDDGDDRKSYRAFLVMMIAVSAFLSFTQLNITGPPESLPSIPLMALASGDGDPASWVEWEAWARNELMLAGSDLLGKFSNLQYVVFAKILLMTIKDLLPEGSIVTMYGNRSISWWLARLLLLQQKILDEKSSSLFDSLQVYTRESLHNFGSLEKVRSYWGAKLPKEVALNMVAMLHLEVGMGELVYGRVDFSRVHFQKAESVSGLHLSLTGALGYRTVHQVEPKAQLLLVSRTSDRNDSTCPSTEFNLQQNVCTLSEDSFPGQNREISEASDVLISPKFVDNIRSSTVRAEDDQKGCVASLNAIQKALILAHCISIEKSSRQDDMQRWEMTPYIEAIDSQQPSCFMIQFCCDMLRVQFESTRSHTKERALLMMEKLVERVSEPFPGVAERIFVCYGVQIPCIPALRREYGNLLVRSGLIGEAVKVYEDLELWDNAIYCYSLLEKKAVAVELIKMRLSERPNDPRLWCSLGDITNDDSCYEKALEVSMNRSARAKRSLARSAYDKGEYETSKVLWESAMALNSLYPDGWFALGAAALKTRDVDKSLDAFTRAVQLDPENGEAWNNIACLHMMKKKNKEAYIAFKEALKFKRNSWELWENYSHVAANINNFGQTMEALKKVLDMTNNKRIDYATLERVMQEVEVQALSSQIESNVTTSNRTFSEKCDISHDAQLTSSDAGLAREQGDRLLVELLGKVLQQIVKSGAGAEIWGLFARWHKLKGDLTMCSEALLKQVRSYQGSDLWKDKDRFKKFAHASLKLSEVYIELASSSGSRRELITAEMHLKNTIKQAVNFSDTEEIKDLQACLDKVQTRLQFLQVP